MEMPKPSIWQPEDTDISAMAQARQLFEAYIAELGLDLGFQDFDTELATLPGRYAKEQNGALLLAGDVNAAIGCVALRQFNDTTCEMKRLYVSPEGRGYGLGKRLAETIVDKARQLGYARMVLDTTPNQAAAVTMYRQMGFTDIPRYYDSPLPDGVYLELML